MTTRVEKSVVVEVPLSTVYNQWTQFEEFPRFMGAVEKVTQLSDDRLEWVAELGGVRRQWIAKILAQVPDQKVAWAAVEGAANAGSVTFTALGPSRTEVHLSMEFEPEGFLEKVADFVNIVGTQAEDDLDNFARFIEDPGRATGAWRGSITETGARDSAGLIGPTTVGEPPLPGDRGLNPTDAADGFGDPAREQESGVVRPIDDPR